MWRIYYSNRVVSGSTKAAWLAAPNADVQVVVDSAQAGAVLKTGGWTYQNAKGENVPVYDRELWTGQDKYNPFGYGVKTGALISDADYFKIWDAACGDDRP